MESMQQHDFIMAYSFGRTRFSQKGSSCKYCPTNVGRFQRSVLTKECTGNLLDPKIVGFFLTSYHDSFNLFHKTQDTYRTLPTCNQMKAHNEQREEDRFMQFLMGLSNTYNVVCLNIFMMSSLLNVCQADSLVIQDNTQRKMTSEPIESFSIATTIQSHLNNFSNKSKDEHCKHYSRE
ncbi:hypothetical protein QQP08_004878, partial [Theobroma cacao]